MTGGKLGICLALVLAAITGGQSRGNPIVGTIDEMFTALTFTIQRWIQF
jgi:hypothetical protein